MFLDYQGLFSILSLLLLLQTNESFVPPVLEIISLAFMLDDASNRHLASSSYTLTPAASPLPLILTHRNSFHPQQTVFTFQALSLSLISFPLPITSTSLSSCQTPPSLCQLTATSMAMCLLLYQASLPFYQAIPHKWEKLHVRIC